MGHGNTHVEAPENVPPEAEDGAVQDGPGTRDSASDRALTPELDSEAPMSIAAQPCDKVPGVAP